MTYTVLINSELKNSGDISDCRDFFDWDIFEAKKYKVHVQFVSSILTSTYNNIPSLFIDLGQSNSFTVNKSLIIAQNTQFITQLHKVESKTDTYLISDTNSQAIYIASRPVVKDFNVRLLNDNGRLFSSQTEFTYTIKLTFEEM